MGLYLSHMTRNMELRAGAVNTRMLSGTQGLSVLFLTPFSTWSGSCLHSLLPGRTKGKTRLSLGKTWPFFFKEARVLEGLLPPARWPDYAQWISLAVVKTAKGSLAVLLSHIKLELSK